MLTTLLGFPWPPTKATFANISTGLATQTFGPWMGDQFKGLLVNLVLGGVLAMVLFGHRSPRTTHMVDLGRGGD